MHIISDFLNSNVGTIPKVGNQFLDGMSRLNIKSFIDLLLHLPSSYQKKLLFPDFVNINKGDKVILKGILQIIDPKPSIYQKHPFKIHLYNNQGFISLNYFNYYPVYIVNKFKVGQELIISGRAEKNGNSVAINHPEIVILAKDYKDEMQNEVVYPLTYGIVSAQIQRSVFFILGKMPIIKEWLSEELLRKKSWKSFKESLEIVHQKNSIFDMGLINKARERLAFDELLAYQMIIRSIRKRKVKYKNIELKFNGDLMDKFLLSNNINLTKGQLGAMVDISNDQKSNNQMFRLLQGDVGCGKTLVAICSILNVIESKRGRQSVIMVPTDVLANQHFSTIKNYLPDYKIELLTSKITGKARRNILDKLENGEIDIIIGTHALIQSWVKFKDLALVIIDEQHRFGVEQRISLLEKGNGADLLFMTATPIPRTLTMTLYGDMDVTRILDKPEGRKEIDTKLIPISKIQEVADGLKNVDGNIYWICPLVEEAEGGDDCELTAVVKRFEYLQSIYGDKVGIVHGKMKNDEKQKSIEDFASLKTKILVATTVIEVGINVPEASVIIIEQAERFGLSQLHQLRGRVGRGDKQSYALLLYSKKLSNNAISRLEIMKRTNDGFLIAEEDLKIRGAGEVIGTKQSGIPDFKVADLSIDQSLLHLSHEYANNIVEDENIALLVSIMLANLANSFYQKIDI